MPDKSFRQWLVDEAALDLSDGPIADERYASELLGALASPDGIEGLPNEIVDKAIWNISGRMDQLLWMSKAPHAAKVECISTLPLLIERVTAAGFHDLTAPSYFWEGIVSSADLREDSLREPILSALERQSDSNDQDALASVGQALESLHGVPGAIELGERILARENLSSDFRAYLSSKVAELRHYYERMRWRK